MSMNGKICPACRIELRPLKNGVDLIEMSTNGPEALWSSDLWHCTECGMEVILGIPDKPYARNGDADWLDQLATYKPFAMPVFLNTLERVEWERDK